MSDIIYGDQNLSLPSHQNYGRYVLDNIVQFKDNIALINAATQKKITYGEMVQQIVNTASYLKQIGVKQNDVVALCSENTIEYLISSLAVFSLGAILACINSAYSKDELIHALNISKPKYVFLSIDTYEKYYKTMKSLKMIDIFFVFGNISSNSDVISFEDIWRRDININTYTHDTLNVATALILYSSGTTGPAKGAKITHKNLILAAQQPVPSSRNLITLFVSPWSSTMGLICTLHEIVFGRTVAFLPKFEENLYLNAIQTYKIGILTLVPPIIVILCKSSITKKYDLSSVETVYSGGAPLNLSIISELQNKFPNIKHVLQGYGMTETTGALTATMEDENKEGSVGKIVSGNIIKIVDVETRKILGPGQTGEVCVKGLVLFDGYIGKDSKDDFDEDGFYKTGDIAYYDADGFFFIVDRMKEIIKYKAWQVPPSELEDLLLQHPNVKDVGVSGRPDILAGELPMAFIVRQPNTNVSETEIIDYVNKKVSPWKRLRGGVIFVKEIPKTGSGKIIRRKLREMMPKQSASKL